MIQSMQKIGALALEIRRNTPRLQMKMTHDVEIHIPTDVYVRAAYRIKDAIGSNDSFIGEIDVPDEDLYVSFLIDCSVVTSPFASDNNAITGVVLHYASANVWDKNGKELTNDFTKEDLEEEIKDCLINQSHGNIVQVK